MWAIAKRVVLFALVNILVLVTASITFTIVSQFFGIPMEGTGAIIFLYALIGFGGAFVSLALSRKMAKWMMGVKLIDPQTATGSQRRLIDMVYSAARKAQLPAMPEVGIYDSPEVNAFATGPTKARSLVAVSTGLLERLDESAVEGVIGHEIAHIANGDMVTMTLLQGLINTMVLVVARMIAMAVSNSVEERSRFIVSHIVFIAAQIVLSLLGSIVVCYFSRLREYRADAGGARLTSRGQMLSGLTALRSLYGQVDNQTEQYATMKINGRPSRFLGLFATHPPIEDRIRRLETLPL